MRSPGDSDPLKRKPDARSPRAQERGTHALHDGAAGGLLLQDKMKPQRWGCPSCTYYDPGCIYCTYIQAPVDVLFFCPQALDRRR